jgi:DNA-binding SARP family transcriptional activator
LPHPIRSPESALLSEAIDIWHETGCRVEEAGARIVAASVGATIPDLGLDRAYETLRECGVDVRSWRTAGPSAAVIRSMGTVSIRTLGVFRVLRNDTLVPAAEWRSKKARDLLKILLAHRRPVARERLMELLWPMEDPGKASKRLSVLLSTVRAVLGFSRQQPDEGPLVTNRDAVWLDLGRLDVDIEHFMTAATEALRMHETDAEQATVHLAAAEARYEGNFLEDEPYLDWADPLREEARALHISVLRALTQRMRAAGDVDRATRYALRLFQHDPYDEQAHLELVSALLAAGRRGEARRRYRAYVRYMTELDALPAPFPSPAGVFEP